MDVTIKKNQGLNKGFTLIEILVVIGIIAILAAVVLIAINPARQFAQARNSQRTSNLQAILNAIGQNMADNKGIFYCGGSPMSLPASSTVIKMGSFADIRNCIVPTYMSEIPVDPKDGVVWTGSNYNTGYEVLQSASTSRILIKAPSAELDQNISIER
ncbi:MAG: hypothetical protein A2131_00515 [Candidatus Sungbacteria bacterium GWC2_49_10]|uniref:Uncharacterized protein n=2 Tax=Parcubacteria group TaxID=1794811 RepID=A0A0G1WQW9_9BACT|nr:MAG: hypothetical protein UY60_C0016G0007 [Parcubacteria group bacterium GW2011_GWB1_50_9]KKW21161.1 MAG: hypothetical protein UY61_C0013G0010 [Candidatus Adlerbacteria bacterium GW2011_GWC1_50_9]OGZ94056.1 MAG: hypothetical protein A2131_00515 [Candidatus Sungbacteria bacterium GWC2_49_10]